MANEGSTKPTEVSQVIEGSRNYWKRRAETAESELARVRGLLQRQWISVEERLPETEPCTQSEQVLTFNGVYVAVGAYHRGNHRYEGYWTPLANISHWRPFPDPPNFPQSSSLVSQGAESADIGKLDGAEKCPWCTGTVDNHKAVEWSGRMCPKSGVEMGKVNRVAENTEGKHE